LTDIFANEINNNPGAYVAKKASKEKVELGFFEIASNRHLVVENKKR